MKRKRTKAARACLAKQIRKHCRKGRHNKCKTASGRAQAAAIGYSICRRQGFKV